MLLDLRIRELEDLKSVWIGRLGRLGLRKVINNFLIRVRLLDIIIVEVDDGVAIWERLPAYAIAENDLLLAVVVRPLHLAVVSDDLILNLRVWLLLVVVLVWELHLVVLFLILQVLVLTVRRQVRRHLLLFLLILHAKCSAQAPHSSHHSIARWRA